MSTRNNSWYVLATILLLVVALVGQPAHAQSEEACGTPAASITSQVGGVYLPSIGTIRILVVFVEFKGDNTDPSNPQWPYNNPPAFLNTVIDANAKQHSTDPNNLTYFFRQMSHELYLFVGNAIYVQTPDSLAKYVREGRSRRYVNEQVLAYLDTQMDFGPYDNWKRTADYTFQNVPDSIVDHILMCYRTNMPPPYAWPAGEASLGYGSGYLSVDGGQRKIHFGYPANFFYPEGSGSTSVGIRDFPYWWDIPKHEYGHWLLGGNEAHNYNAGLWSLMGWHIGTVSTMLNSFERERLGWLSFTPATNDIVPLGDYATQHVACRMTIPNTNPQEYLLIENHRLLSNLDVVDWNGGAGVYVIHQRGEGIANNLKVVAATGRWNWQNPYWIPHPYGGSGEIPVYQRMDVSRFSGLTYKDAIPHTRGGSGIIEAYIDPFTSQQVIAPLYKKDGFASFVSSINNVFSPWSNPAAATWSGTQTTLGFHVMSEAGNIANIKFYTSGADAAPPSKPQDLRLSSSVGQYGPILVSWAANIEPDLASYEVSRKVDLYGNIWEVVVPSTANTSWVDPEYYYAPGGGDFRPTYRVRATDTQGLYSVYSDSASVRAEQGKRSAFNELVPSSYSLEQNYPNPFNPTTTLSYTLPEDVHISLKVFDLLGREVLGLVDEVQKAGRYQLKIDASKLASGIYFYKLQAGTFTNIKRMLLLK